MKAIIRTKYGTPEVLEVKEIDKPVPKSNEVLVKVHCTTVNRTDWGGLTGKPYLIRLFIGLLKPTLQVPGTDFSGQIEAVGEQVKTFKVGDRVWGFNDQGLASQAEYLTINEKEPVVLIPEGMAYDEVVSCAEGAHYAYNCINKVRLEKGNKVLVNGATGAIGSAALQILKSLDIQVTAVGNTKNLELLKSLGADKVYNFETEDFTQIDKEKYHFVFDAVGKSTFGKCKSLLLPKGIYVSSELGPNSENLYLPLLTKFKRGKRVIFPIPSDCKRSLLYVKNLIEKGQFKAVIDRHYKPDEIHEAYKYACGGNKTGSVIVDFV
ncbi:MAG: NADPH:quinone reductase-like Zn-dependent oxidoreductase [Saprospiraceae bacterium]|jgi:NADPH:quinone reductase-like Zn-dependent oxidoreductase